MKVTRGRLVRINLGNYEHIETSATVEQEVHDEVDINTIVAKADEALDKLLEADIKDAESASGLDSDASFVFTWTDARYAGRRGKR